MLKNISLTNIRLFSKLDLTFNHQLVFFIGDNAIGKTTILEAIYMLGLTKSPRSNDEDVLKLDSKYGKINGYAEKEYQLVLNGNEKKVFIAKNEVKKFSDYIGNLNIILFSPNDLQLVYGSPGERRKFLDINISQFSKNYLQALGNYKQLLKERNEILKNKPDLVLLDVVTSKLGEEAIKVIKYREKFIKEINESLFSFSKEKIELFYLPSIKADEYSLVMESKKEYDLISCVTNYGPHRDDIRFMLDGKDVNYCSQGQVRGIVLSVKLSLIEIFKKYAKKAPLVLLDDVLSELDSVRKNSLLNQLGDENQVFITSTDLLGIDKKIIDKAQVINLKELKKNGSTL